ncbi:MAG: hypothetical protein N2255_09145, partial [Kiritimatiellae bacterium]|nr:hypothetical protein [Kiritimatiellia bacterium]
MLSRHVRVRLVKTRIPKLFTAGLVTVGLFARGQEALPFKVRTERPRIWIRAEDWHGPSLTKLRRWFQLPEYKQRGVEGHKALQYLVNGDLAAGSAAVEALLKARITGSSPSYRGAETQEISAHYDWLRNHPDFNAEKRAGVIAMLEQEGDSLVKYCTGASAPLYYSRYPGAIGGLCLIGLTLYGDNPKAEEFIRVGYKSLVEYGRARAYEDGASAGGTYSIHHAFPDLARAVFAFESATDANLLRYIREQQENWIEKQLYWQIWSTLPNGYFVKEGDLWQQPDARQVRMQGDVLTHLLHNGYGRAHADAMFLRWNTGDYHRNYVWNFFVFNNPEIPPASLENLGRAALFGRDSHGYVIFRDGWGRGNTHIFFRCGEGLDVHSNRGAGAFDIYRHEILAQRANKDYPGDDDHIKYSNTMVFNDHNHPSTEMKTDIPLDFDGFLQRKQKGGFEWASITDFEVTEKFARVRGDISAAVREDCQSWTRELVYLDYKYLIVLDRVETKPIPVVQKWQIHLLGDVKTEGSIVW